MKKSILFSILFLSVFTCFSQQKGKAQLSGKITDATTSAPVSGVSVTISDLKLGVVTDTSGNYTFHNLPQGNFLVEARSIGYKSISKNIVITGTVTEDFALSENAIEEQAVVVTGLSKATQIRRSPIPIVSINHDAIATNLNTNIIDALTKVPGVSAVTTGPNISKPYIRGLGFNRILTLYDGVRQEGQQWGDEHGVEVDPYSIDRAEVVKGPSSLTYGSDALAGVVNLIPTQPAAEGKIKGEVITEYHTNNGLIGATGMLAGTKNGFEWLGRISHRQATNYQNSIDGRVYGTAFNESSATAYLGTHGSWGFSHLSFSYFNDLQLIPDGSRDSATGKFTKQITEDDLFRPVVSDQELRSYSDIANVTHQHIRHARFYSNNNFILGSGRLTVNLAFQNSHRQEFSHPEQLATPGLDLNLKTYNYDVKYFLSEISGWSPVVGVNGMYQTNDVTKGTEFVIPSYHQFDVGPFLMIHKNFQKLDVSGGVRFDSRSYTNDALYTQADPVSGFDKPYYGPVTAQDTAVFVHTSQTFSGFSGSLGFTYNVNDNLSFKANVSRGFRAPNVAELSANGVHPGTNIYQIGDAFQPEFSFQQDIGMTYSSRYLVIDFSLFNNYIKNYIFNQRLVTASGADSIIVAGNQTYKFQQGKAQLYGGEMNIDIHPVHNLHFENSLSVVYGLNQATSTVKITPDSKYLPLIPPFHGLSELRYDFASHHLTGGFIKAQVAYTASQNRVYAADNTETPTPGYTLVNFGVGTGFANRAGKIVVKLSVMGNNLFDVAYYNHLSRLKYFSDPVFDPNRGIHEMGRNIALRVEFPLSFDTEKSK